MIYLWALLAVMSWGFAFAGGYGFCKRKDRGCAIFVSLSVVLGAAAFVGVAN